MLFNGLQDYNVLHKTIGFRRVKTNLYDATSHVNSAYQHVTAPTTKIPNMPTLSPKENALSFPF